MSDLLHRQFIIDGTSQDFTPAQMLDECNGFYGSRPCESSKAVIDETIDPRPTVPQLDPSCADAYAGEMSQAPDEVSAMFPEASTKLAVACALADSIWTKGEHTIDDVSVDLRWSWPSPGKVGDMAAFYASSQAAADYIGGLGLQIGSYDAQDGPSRSFLVHVNGSGSDRACPSKAISGDSKSWIVYIPLDTCDFRLGGSALFESHGSTGSSAPQIVDADYFLDCYEVLRELVQDGIVLAGTTVGRGGLFPALKDFCPGRFKLTGIREAYPQCSTLEIMFSEVPGVLIQIRDDDFDYLDAELLLQDVAFYPLGHPSEGGTTLESESSNSIHRILDSIIQSAATEGED